MFSRTITLFSLCLFTLSFSAFGTSPEMASKLEREVKAYDAVLLKLAKRTEPFIRDFAPDLENELKAGETGSLTYLYTAHKDKKLGKEGQSVESVKALNELQFSQIARSNDLTNEQPLRPEQTLTLDQAKQLLISSHNIFQKNMDHLRGPCFLRAAHIAYVVSEKYPNLPLIRIWMIGSMFNRNNKTAWTYHVAPAIPVNVNDRIQWMMLDTLRVNSGPLSLENWVKETHQEYKFTSKVTLYFSAGDRIGPEFGTTLEKIMYSIKGYEYTKAIFDSKNALQ
jgi:hypothetical protein